MAHTIFERSNDGEVIGNCLQDTSKKEEERFLVFL